MGGLEHGTCPDVARVGMTHRFREVDRVDRTAGRDLFLGAGDDPVGAGEVDEVGAECVGGDVVKLSGGAVVKPAGVVLPDRPHIPGDLSVALADVEFGRQRDLPHQRVDIRAGVHARDGPVVDVRERVAQPGQLGVDASGAGDRLEMSGDQNLGPQLANALDRGDRGQCVAVAVAAHRDQVRDVAEDRSERIAAQADLLLR